MKKHHLPSNNNDCRGETDIEYDRDGSCCPLGYIPIRQKNVDSCGKDFLCKARMMTIKRTFFLAPLFAKLFSAETKHNHPII